MTRNRFRPGPTDFQIESDDNRLIGTLRVEPNRILWGDAETKKWRAVTLEQFQAWINDEHTSKLVER